MLGLFVRMALNTKLNVFYQWQDGARGSLHSVLKVQADGDSSSLNERLPRSVTIDVSTQETDGCERQWRIAQELLKVRNHTFYWSAPVTWLYFSAEEAGSWSLACPGGKGTGFGGQPARVPL